MKNKENNPDNHIRTFLTHFILWYGTFISYGTRYDRKNKRLS